jgi:hypothetical protein
VSIVVGLIHLNSLLRSQKTNDIDVTLVGCRDQCGVSIIVGLIHLNSIHSQKKTDDINVALISDRAAWIIGSSPL